MFRFVPFVMLVCLFAFNCALPSSLLADYYKYTDGHGVVNISNDLKSVPAKYRSTMKVVREEPKKEQVQRPAVQAEAESEAVAAGREQTKVAAPESQPEEPQGRFSELASRFPWLKPLAYLAGIVALFVVMAKLTSKLSSPHLSKVIYISFFMGVMVFLYKNYVEHVVASTAKVKDAAVSMMKKSSNRELPVPAGELPPVEK